MAAEGEVYTDDEGNIIEAPAVEVADEDAAGEDQPAEASSAEVEAEDGDEDERNVTHAEENETDENREAIRERRRQERHQRKVKQKEREDSLRSELAARDAELAQLRDSVNTIQRRNNSSELAQLQQAKQQISNAYNHFKEQIKVATEAADGATVADATEKMMLARQRYSQLENIERAYTQQQQAPGPLDPRLQQHAEKWMGANKWYDPSGKDEDSAIMLTVDNRMAQEGWNPTTPEYWNELSKRGKKFLPHRFNVRTAPPPARSVVGGSGRESSAGSGAQKGFRLSPERVQAIKDAGMWNDAEKRAAMIKSFRKFDKENGQQ